MSAVLATPAIRRLGSTHAPDPKEPVEVFWADDRSALEPALADTIEPSRSRESGRPRAPADNHDKFAAERLHPAVANWHSRRGRVKIPWGGVSEGLLTLGEIAIVDPEA